jgi:hypothetical protein
VHVRPRLGCLLRLISWILIKHKLQRHSFIQMYQKIIIFSFWER